MTAYRVVVEIDLAKGLSSFTIVGLADKAIKESKERIKAALVNSGFRFPTARITVNLAPAHLKKQDMLFDVPIAVALLVAAKIIPQTEQLSRMLFLGELGLDGSIRGVPGVLSLMNVAHDTAIDIVIVPLANAAEAALDTSCNVIGVSSLTELVALLRKEKEIAFTPTPLLTVSSSAQVDMSGIKGQWEAKRALELAAIGGHHVLLVGPPGSGKSMLAHALRSIMPPLSSKHLLEVIKIYSIAGMLGNDMNALHIPFRAPHHTISRPGLMGGGTIPKPGEISLAHYGLLFFDEILEAPRATLDSLRQPLEERMVHITRSQQTFTFPAHFQLIAACNPCPCGYAQDGEHDCTCVPGVRDAYWKRLSGPIHDRIDMRVWVKRLSFDQVHAAPDKTATSDEIRKRVCNARLYQQARGQTVLNAALTPDEVGVYCSIEHIDTKLLRRLFATVKGSVRSYHKLLKVARTIADSYQEEQIQAAHLLEALSFRFQ